VSLALEALLDECAAEGLHASVPFEPTRAERMLNMTLVGLLVLLLVGAICGVVAELVVGFSPGGFLASAVIGFVGAYLGSLMARHFGLPRTYAITVEGFTFDVVWTLIGAMLLLIVLSMLRRHRLRAHA
jgi:uncharacterized membrane protein YeaQ/YmgE (transglycosylase-associated protein family)